MKAARNFSDPRARQVAERAAFLKLHKGHEMMHLEMILVMFITLILAQVRCHCGRPSALALASAPKDTSTRIPTHPAWLHRCCLWRGKQTTSTRSKR